MVVGCCGRFPTTYVYLPGVVSCATSICCLSFIIIIICLIHFNFFLSQRKFVAYMDQVDLS